MASETMRFLLAATYGATALFILWIERVVREERRSRLLASYAAVTAAAGVFLSFAVI